MLGLRSRFPKVCSVEPRAQEMSHWGKKKKKGFLIQLWGQEAKHTLNKLLFTSGHCREGNIREIYRMQSFSNKFDHGTPFCKKHFMRSMFFGK